MANNASTADANKTKRALLVVDIQNDYFPGGLWPLCDMDAAADKAARVLEAARTAGDLVVHIRHEFTTTDAPFFKSESVGAQIHPKAQNLKDEYVVVKRYTNSYRETNLKEILDRHGVKQVVICGAMSQNCIDAVTRASFDFGYECVVIHDACATRDLEFNGIPIPAKYVHAAFMAALQFAYAKTVSTDEYLAGGKN
ncbi:unnamed protein product [Rotaria magnacalcarata]|uniref:Isochorismatase-like domain-containing protein n=1 Tax=Rotaria magnacalcarata TaxID=392030 RepID=A0A816U9E1_9BILA|nr:unnamed protein product [Rotaria magnacalcarata]CAF2100463.1 unnamed protein product [Rotaria magnacalcarata]CAF2111176.1 unnamed protein product [Rotaria magnacalcarata]CAF3896650.1 unnamed protein product [Rotaria magnacalcarata]CAF4309559.1 unnamed protein product [Rotaria magnacalcarata]